MRFIKALPAIAIVLAACSSQPPVVESNSEAVREIEPSSVVRDVVDLSVAPSMSLGQDRDSVLHGRGGSTLARSVFFDLDQFVIKDEFRPALGEHARLLGKNSKAHMLIQGHADDRGSREYNLALGQKRANAIRKALMALGVRDEQLESVSLGEEKPMCSVVAESCWAQNRRGDLLYSGLLMVGKLPRPRNP